VAPIRKSLKCEVWMMKRTLTAAAVFLLITSVSGGVFGAQQGASAMTPIAAAYNCCDDPNCPPGCAPDCPPDCGPTRDCRDDPSCPPGCSSAWAPHCHDAADANAGVGEQGQAKPDCAPCAECP
jgi:hypothetical protein